MMEKFTLKDLVISCGGRFIFGNPNQPVQDISTDSRTIRNGDVFIALKGKNYDGHNFIVKAVEAGAAVVISEKMPAGIDGFFPNLPSLVVVKDTLKALGDIASGYKNKFFCETVCVTGSNGKTTTKEMIYSILSLKAPTLASYGNYNNQIGLPLTIFKLESGHKYCVLELGISLKGEMDSLIEIASPDIGIVTNVGRTHLQFLGSIETVGEEKMKLLRSIKPGGIAALNADDPILLPVLGSLTVKTVTFGLKAGADIMADNIKNKSGRTVFNLLYGGKSAEINLSVCGKFNVYNALAASAAAYALGIGLDTVKEGLEKFRPPQMRMEVTEMPSGAVIINDAYNANPDSMKNAVESFIECYPGRKKILVLGDMLELGEKSEQEHAAIGEFLKKFESEGIYLYGRAMKYAADILNGRTGVYYCTELEEIIARLKPLLAMSENAILIKGSRAEGLEKIVDRLVIY